VDGEDRIAARIRQRVELALDFLLARNSRSYGEPQGSGEVGLDFEA
jgi:hypothetical protein